MTQIKRLQDPQKNSGPPVTKEVNLTLLPPDNLQILRRVGSDGLLISWMPPDDDEVTGYLVMIVMFFGTIWYIGLMWQLDTLNRLLYLTLTISNLDLCWQRATSESSQCGPHQGAAAQPEAGHGHGGQRPLEQRRGGGQRGAESQLQPRHGAGGGEEEADREHETQCQ